MNTPTAQSVRTALRVFYSIHIVIITLYAQADITVLITLAAITTLLVGKAVSNTLEYEGQPHKSGCYVPVPFWPWPMQKGMDT